jgi:hypothetical protein
MIRMQFILLFYTLTAISATGATAEWAFCLYTGTAKALLY